MILPGGDALILKACEIIFEHFEALEARYQPGYQPRRFADLSANDQFLWMRPQRAVIELTVKALLVDMASAVGNYDGCQGAAYERTVHRYALTELDFPMFQE
jgi:hypothetical protein